ncbi:unnamed protein product, partial [Brassica rapa subsp. trilocularis]
RSCAVISRPLHHCSLVLSIIVSIVLSASSLSSYLLIVSFAASASHRSSILCLGISKSSRYHHYLLIIKW